MTIEPSTCFQKCLRYACLLVNMHFTRYRQAVSWNRDCPFHFYLFFLVTPAGLPWNYTLSLVAIFYVRKQKSTFFASF